MKLPAEAVAAADPIAAARYLEAVESLPEPAAMPADVAALDHNIRVWLDRDDIAAWIRVATAAGLNVEPLPPRRRFANPISADED